MQQILAIEASTQAGSVALAHAGQMKCLYDDSPRNHTRTLLPFVDQLLQHSALTLDQLDAIAFAQGPGSFTGLRLAAGVAQGLAYAACLPVVGVSTLQALAQAAIRLNIAAVGDVIISCIDARMDEVYHAAFIVGEQGLEPLIDDQLIQPQNWPLIPGSLVLLGDGVELLLQSANYAQADIKDQRNDLLPHAQDVLMLAQGLLQQGKQLQPHQAEPVYLRDSSAWQTLSQQAESKSKVLKQRAARAD